MMFPLANLIARAGLISVAAFSISPAVARPPGTVAVVGDSTVCNYPQDSRLRGWGQMLPSLLPGTEVQNEAQAGRSTKTFPRDRWERVLTAKPEYVLIQFGHNDSHEKSKPESTDAETDFRVNLRRFIDEARAAGIGPILVTPPRRRLFRDGRPTRELEPYAEAILAVAAETGTPLIDLYAETGRLFSELGESGSAAFTANRPPDAPTGTPEDRTHFTKTGARALAQFVASRLRSIAVPQTSPSPDESSPERSPRKQD